MLNLSRVLCFLAIMVISATAVAQSVSTASRIQQLHSDSTDTRSRASQNIFGAGLTDPVLYQELAAILADGLDGITKDSERLDELAWHAKALGGSGDMTYMPLLDRMIQTGIRHLVKHAKDAKEILAEAAETGQPYMDWEKVMIITEKQADSCRLISQNTCSNLDDDCLADHKINAIEAGGDAVMVVMTSGGDSAFFGIFSSSTVVANYYDCRPAPAAINTAPLSPAP